MAYSRVVNRQFLRNLHACIVILIALTVSQSFAQQADVLFIPVRASGVEGIDWFLGPAENEITLTQGGQDVVAEIHIQNFAPDDVAIYSFMMPCNHEDSDGGTEPGPVAFSTPVCPDDAVYAYDICSGVDEGRPDWLFHGFPEGIVYRLCRPESNCPHFPLSCGAFINPVGVPDGGDRRYLVTYAMSVDADAVGSYTITPIEGANISYIRGQASSFAFELPELLITVGEGRCCGGNGNATDGTSCIDQATAQECTALGGGFYPGGTCGDEEAGGCPTCVAASDCEVPNACLTVSCVDGLCVNTDLTPASMCCHPTTGELTVIDDEDACTLDACLADGSVLHRANHAEDSCCNPATGELTSLDDQNLCTFDTCHPDGTVTHEADPACDTPVTFRLVPTRASGQPGVDWVLGPGENEISLSRGDQMVELELRISGFGQVEISTYQGVMDPETMTGDGEGVLTSVDLSCPIDAEFGVDFCNGVDSLRSDHIFASGNSIGACSTGNQSGCFWDNGCGAAFLTGEHPVDQGELFYGATFAYHVSKGAVGTFMPALFASCVSDGSIQDYTFLLDNRVEYIEIEQFIPATITITQGICQVNDVCQCAPVGDCEAMGGVVLDASALCEFDFDGDGTIDYCDEDTDNDGFFDVNDFCDFTPSGIPLGDGGQHVSDIDYDCRLGQADYAQLAECLEDAGPAPDADPGLSCRFHFDRDDDQRLDLIDVGAFFTDYGSDDPTGSQ